jgi:transcription initiation factor IIE alpha subunit
MAKYRMGYCRDCGKRSIISRKAMNSRFPSRCTTCGGMLEMSDPGKREGEQTREIQKHIEEYHERHRDL